MHLRTLLAAALLAAAALLPVARAADKAEPTIPSDKTNYLSDRVKFSFAMAVRRVDLTKNATEGTVDTVCAPAYTTFKGIGRLSVTVNGKSEQQAAFVVTNVPDESKEKWWDGKPVARCTDPKSIVVKDDIVLIPEAHLLGTPPDRYGLTYGALLVPYKYQLKGDKGFASKASVGGYLGFRQDKSGITGLALQYVGFLGAATVPVVQEVNGQSTTQQLSGVSYGLALLGTVKGEFQMGIVLGADRVSKNANYVNNGKPWIAVSLGFAFGG